MFKYFTLVTLLLLPVTLADRNQTLELPELVDLKCDSCLLGVSLLKALVVSDRFITEGVDLVGKVCKLIEEDEVCDGLLNQYANVALEGLADRYLDPSYACFKIGFCNDPFFIEENFTHWRQEVLVDTPEAQPWPISNSETFKFLHVSDIHIDPDYIEGSIADCNEPICCHSGKSETNGAGYWGTKGNCDLPPRTVELFLEQVSKMNLTFVLWTGDSPPHNIWKYSRENHTQFAKTITQMFKRYLPNVPVYPVIGNHGCYPMDEFAPGKESWILSLYADMWKDYLDAAALEQFKHNGYYSMKDRATGLRLLGLNTQFGDVLNFKVWANSTDPANMLTWMRKELYLAEKENEKVFIFGHIPAGDHFTDSIWGRHYSILINRFRNIITGQFFGHTHNDHFQLVSSSITGLSPGGVINIAPSLTTFSDQNPSFRIYEVDKETLLPVDYHQYRLLLSSANNYPDSKPLFDLVYSAKSLYDMKDLSPASYAVLAEKLQNDPSILYEYYLNFYASYDGEVPDCDSACSNQLICGALHSVFTDYAECAGDITKEELIFKYLQPLMEPWVYRVNK
jgi:sphingomyelin phosphodiesterase